MQYYQRSSPFMHIALYYSGKEIKDQVLTNHYFPADLTTVKIAVTLQESLSNGI